MNLRADLGVSRDTVGGQRPPAVVGRRYPAAPSQLGHHLVDGEIALGPERAQGFGETGDAGRSGVQRVE
jgi:hypothetical protein